ncbi:hypothetical protein NEOC65_001503 [Neochlamydia sp. AcF65]|nr:hypothetical protein [Neochlamydia sp. AcF65]MBS4169300.1 hypothetical protein [Neochlamydia sp. AcF95]
MKEKIARRWVEAGFRAKCTRSFTHSDKKDYLLI